MLLTACGTAEAGPEARPAMWLVEDADTKIYILGTMHALPRGTDWDEGRVASAIEASDALMLELPPAELAAAGEMFRKLAPRDTPLAIEARLSGKALTGFRALEASGRSFGEDGLDDWAVMVLMGQRVAQNAGLSPADGVETGLTEKFKAAGKPIGGFETAREQLTLFETLDPQTQRILLTRAAEEAEGAVKEVGALTAAWGRGDVAALEKVINEDIDSVPAARKAIITDRNRRWSAWIERRMAQPGTVLVAVGAGHLVGSDGVPALVAADGLTVTRVQ
ncbi:TraB/GumN family protein [Sphingopyxis sp.]|uniref:TraB/GumN family protein n=1 Tax=Sphingopyxis sp. TaxID=1908224 RepID=UPI002D7830F6|nr:TraB/GumN family protein [Sphingopyxis sp.]HET6527038.1 TraB/GumN family protein [Sphingopyxis sp.]